MKYKLIALLSAAMLLLPLAGCTSYVDVSGYVYEWVNAPAGAQGSIIVGDKAPSEYQLRPIKDAKITLEDEDKSHRFELASGEDGYFHLGTTVELAEDIDIEVSRSGYQTTLLRFGVEKEKYFYSFVVLLVPGAK